MQRSEARITMQRQRGQAITVPWMQKECMDKGIHGKPIHVEGSASMHMFPVAASPDAERGRKREVCENDNLYKTIWMGSISRESAGPTVQIPTSRIVTYGGRAKLQEQGTLAALEMVDGRLHTHPLVQAEQ